MTCDFEDGSKMPKKIIKCPELVYNQYRETVDSHNSLRIFPIDMDEVWNTMRLQCHFFASCKQLLKSIVGW